MAEAEEKGYRKLDIYRRAHDLAVRVHEMSMKLPAQERYEEASQIRRSSKSVSAQIVEGHALRKYKKEFLHYLYRALGSSDETREHLELLKDTGSLKDNDSYTDLAGAYEDLSRMIAAFARSVESQHSTPAYLSSEESKI